MQKVYVEKSGGKYTSWVYQDGKQFYLKTAYIVQEIILWAKRNKLKVVHIIN